MVFVAAFVAWELRVLSPMLDMRFFIDPRFSVASLAIAFTFFGMYGTSFVLTQYLQEILGLTPLGAGAMAVPQALTFFLVATQGASRAVDRLGSRIVVVTGLGSLSLSWVLLATVGKSTPLSVIVAVTCLTGAGMGLLLGPATGLIMTSVPRARAGVGSAMNDTTRQIGGALGVAVLGTILTSFARGGLGGEVVGLADPKAFLTGMHAAELVAGVVVAAALGPALRWLPAHKQELVLEEEPI